jgi:beta-lactam-binding protein with PASTA domain
MENSPGNLSDSSGKQPVRRVLSGSFTENILNILHFVFGFVGWSVRWSFALLFFLLVMGGAAWFVFNQAVQGGSYVQVPDVVGLPVTEASNRLIEAGLDLGEQRHVRNPNVAEYHIIMQRPSPNQVVRTGRKIMITVSAGRDEIELPDLKNISMAKAIETIEQLHLIPGAISRIPNDAPLDTVLNQEPLPKASLASGVEVNLLISDGPESIPMFMPDLKGKSIEEARLLLSTLNVVPIAYTIDREGVEYDVVLNQFPSPGKLLAYDQPITYDVRLSPNTTLANTREKVTIHYIVPSVSSAALVRVEKRDETNRLTILYPLGDDYVDGKAPRHPRGTQITFNDIPINEWAVIDFFVNGTLHQSYRYELNAEPEFSEIPLDKSTKSGFGENLPPITQ